MAVQQQESKGRPGRTDQLVGGPCPTVRHVSFASFDHHVSTYAALQWATIDVVAIELTDGHGRVLMSVHLDKGEPAVRLEASLGDVAKVLEERDKILLGRVWGEVADIASCLPSRSLGDDGLIGLNSSSWELVVRLGEGSGRSHAHRDHGLLLGK